jgi:hypothetical protein
MLLWPCGDHLIFLVRANAAVPWYSMAYKYYSNNLSNSLNSFNTGVGPLLSSSDWCPQKSLPEGTDYCERKIKFLKANHDKLVEVCVLFALFSVVDLLIKTIRKTVFFWSKSW